MEQKQNPRRTNGPKSRSTSAAKAKPGDDAAFDNWLEGKLKGAYNSVLDEPLPDELVRLLSEKLKE